MTPFTDDELMRRVSAGDAEAFAGLYERHKRPLFTFLLRLAGDRRLAEDLLQETFVRVYRARGSYQPAGLFRTWLFTIARRLMIDHVRRERIDWDEDPKAVEQAVARARAEDRAEASDLLARLERALAHLSPRQREVILLSRFTGMEAAEIAEVVGSTPGAVRVELHRALRRLRSLLE